MSDIDRSRAQQLMWEADIDALVLFQPEAFRYAVGAHAGVATMWGRAGSAIALVPADAGAGLAAIVSDHAAPLIRKAAPDIDLRCHRIWIDMVDLSGVETVRQVDNAYRRNNSGGPRPETFDRAVCFKLLADLLRERGLASARIGADLEFMPAADFLALRQALPDVNWIDGSAVLRRLRAVKSEREIELLRRAAAAAEAGLVAMAAAARPGAALGGLSAAWKAGAQAHAKTSGFSLSGHWDYISVGPALSDMAAVVTPGALIKADVGTLVDGYSSDGARTFSWGLVSPLAVDIFKALEAAFESGLDALRPGNSFGAVHAAMLASMRRDGFSEYYRGHFGHSVGGGVGIEEWPFFSHDNAEIILPGMVVALEAPFYGEGLGALMIEDQFLVTSSGTECMNKLPRTLRDLSRE
ncbi:Xaa-Pro aminopeptidase [Agrobacterium fabrum]|uniref:M24 family metallopeptidase n=1 Tax=Agrobacterium fabrum TaxID=1176649 RepID=UPI000888FC36|nr:Xaa-Pro peptidase family protein [Agrobacterium fabrum]MDH6295474.1 Xaa-Pro aminopeptidase [Agrobacterium fabrum]SDB73475.1 Xaa-Pro aminopeptidase [Agrobacterium fabrum]SER85397.1 Xaa-Pro aminopeptidase [Agrobacterium fabrum]